MSAVKLSYSMRVALETAGERAIGAWDFASGTLGALKKLGFVEHNGLSGSLRWYRITAAGRAALESK